MTGLGCQKWGFRVVGAVLALAAFIVVLIGSILVVSQDRSFFAREYEELGVYKYVGMSEVDLARVTDALLVYLSEPNPARVEGVLEVEADIFGEWRQFLNEREIDHMADVRKLFQFGLWLCVGSVGVVLGMLVLLAVCLWRFRAEDIFARILGPTLTGFWVGNGLMLGFLAFLVLWANMDFQGFWTAVHMTLFTNELWLLDPTKDLLIRIMQGELFFNMSIRIVVWAGAIWLGISAGMGVGHFFWRRKSLRPRTEVTGT